MKFKNYFSEKVKHPYQQTDYVILKKSGLDKIKKQNPKENPSKYRAWNIVKFRFKDYTNTYDITVAPTFVDDLNRKVMPFTAKIDIEDIERKTNITGKK